MAYKRKSTKRKSTRKGGFKKRIPRVVKWKNNSVMGKGFPKKMTMTHKYHDLIEHGSISGVAGFYKFSCNNMTDPNVTGVGHTPYYFPICSAVYNHYTVIGSKITVRVVPTVANTPAYYVTLSQNDDNTQTNNTMNGTAEQSSGSVRIVPYNNNDKVITLVNKWSAKKTFGGSILANDNLQGNAASGPAEQTMWSIGLRAVDETSTFSVRFDVSIEYIAVWDEIKDIITS